MAVVKDGQVVYAKGFGFRDVQKGLKVTPDTLFAIGSCSKAFTATALAILVDEGKLEWDKPVRDYLPGFRLQDAYATANLRPRDLVTHQSGLPRHDLVAKRYLSIGCIPCTSPVRPGEDARAGRWRGKAKTECGIHTDFVHAGDGI